MEETRICNKCGIDKPTSDYYNKLNGKQKVCKKCDSEYKRSRQKTVRVCEQCKKQFNNTFGKKYCSRKCLHKHYESTWIDTVCASCGKKIHVRKRTKTRSGHEYKQRFCNKKCESLRTMELHPGWKGGVRIVDGYVMVRIGNGKKGKSAYEYQHRLVMESHINRSLTKDDIVHHLNGVRDDNRLENLCIVTNETHESGTFAKLLKERIRELENEIRK